MERLRVQSVAWRGFALLVLLLAVVLVAASPAATGIGINWGTAKALYWLTAVLGLLGYSFGFRILSVAFWRVFAIIFTIEIAIRTTGVIGPPLLAQVAGMSPARSGGPFPMLLAVALVALTCIALLRYAYAPAPPLEASDILAQPKVSALRRAIVRSQANRVISLSRKTFNSSRRVISAALLTAVPGTILVWMPLSAVSDDPFWMFFVSGLIVLPFVLIGLILAAPGMLLLRHYHRNSVFSYLLLGIVIGMLVGFFLGGTVPAEDPVRPAPPFNSGGALLGVGLGAGYGLWGAAMWCLVFRRRADHAR